MSSKHNDDLHIRASVETVTRHVSEHWRQKLSALRAGLDQQISELEAGFDQRAHETMINAAVKHLSHEISDRAQQMRQQTEATASQALAAIEAELRARLASETSTNAALRAELEELKEELEKKSDALTASDRQVRDLTAERAELQQRLSNATTARTAADAQVRQLETVSHKLSSALAQMLRDRDPGTTKARRHEDEPTTRTRDLEEGAAPEEADSAINTAPITRAPAAPAVSPPPGSVHKKALQFSTPARDAKRVRMRRGVTIDVDGIAGELVDLSLGGAQTLLRNAVKVNQLVRLTIPMATGAIVCKARIVWTVFEQRRTSVAMYRTGLAFIDADTPAIEEFMSDFGEEPSKQARHSSGAA